MRHETTRLLVENTGSKLLDISFGKDFLGIEYKKREIKLNINKGKYIKLKSFYIERGPSTK